MQYGQLEVAELSLVFKAGDAYFPDPGASDYAMRNLTEGTSSKSSEEIARFFDGRGAWVSQDSEPEYSVLNLAGLSSGFEELLPVFSSLWLDPSFPKEEFEQMRTRDIQKVKVSQRKTSWQAGNAFAAGIYGKDHTYYRYHSPEDIEKISLESIKAFHREMLRTGNVELLVVGRFDEGHMLGMLDSVFGSLVLTDSPELVSKADLPLPSFEASWKVVEMEGLQSSLRMGHLGIPRHHPDYYALSVTNTVFGGYFGSRLMKAIREEKGLTYGIHSSLVSHRVHGHFVISTDVANESVTAARDAVKEEMHKLITHGVTEEELKVVKQVMLGQSLNQRETPFQVAEVLRFSRVTGLSFAEIDRRFEVITHITPDEVKEMASRYLHPEAMLEVAAGKPA